MRKQRGVYYPKVYRSGYTQTTVIILNITAMRDCVFNNGELLNQSIELLEKVKLIIYKVNFAFDVLGEFIICHHSMQE